MHDARDGAGPAHVHRHVLHARRGFDADAAGIEDHALADQGEGFLVSPAVPFHHHDLGGRLRPLPHRQKCAHAELFEVGFLQHLDLDAEVGEGLQPGGELRGGQDIRRFVHQIAGKEHAFRHGTGIGEGGFGLVGPGGHHGDGGGGAFVVAGLVVAEVIAAQGRAQHGVGQAAQRAAKDQQIARAAQFGDRGPGAHRLHHMRATVEFGDGDGRGRDPGREAEVQHFARVQFIEGRAVDRPFHGPLGQPVQTPRLDPQRPVGGDETGDYTVERGQGVQIGFDKADGGGCGHGMLRESVISRDPKRGVGDFPDTRRNLGFDASAKPARKGQMSPENVPGGG